MPSQQVPLMTEEQLEEALADWLISRWRQRQQQEQSQKEAS